MRGPEAVTLIVAIIWLAICAVIAVRWIVFRARQWHVRYNFYITDIWAAMFGLLPSIYLLARAIKNDIPYGVVAIVLIFQLFGIAMGRTMSFPMPGEKMPRRLNQAWTILTGAWLLAPLLFAAYAFSLIVLLVMVAILISIAMSLLRI